MAELGVPNYFGEQRFGRAGGNIELARRALSGRRMHRDKRNMAISAARSLLFNEILSARVRAVNWNTVMQGELANLDGKGSVFAVDELSVELQHRCAAFDIHPTGSLWGSGAPLGDSFVAEIERNATRAHEDLAEGLINARVPASSRSLRLKVEKLQFEFGDGVLWLEFSLAKGGYATAVLREIARTD
jgi:tRNA pseudouridine13 synthase